MSVEGKINSLVIIENYHLKNCNSKKLLHLYALIINTGTTIITFLMVFVIQHSQNKDTVAIQLKLNELIAASHEASNRLISIEDLTDEELDVLKKFYTHLAQLAKKERNVFSTHSIDEAKRKNSLKNIESESAITKIKK